MYTDNELRLSDAVRIVVKRYVEGGHLTPAQAINALGILAAELQEQAPPTVEELTERKRTA